MLFVTSRLTCYVFLSVFTIHYITSLPILNSTDVPSEGTPKNQTWTKLIGRTNQSLLGVGSTLNLSTLNHDVENLVTPRPTNMHYGRNYTIRTNFNNKTEMWTYISSLMSDLVYAQASKKPPVTDKVQTPAEQARYYMQQKPPTGTTLSSPQSTENGEGTLPETPTTAFTMETSMLDVRKIVDEELLPGTPFFRSFSSNDILSSLDSDEESSGFLDAELSDEGLNARSMDIPNTLTVLHDEDFSSQENVNVSTERALEIFHGFLHDLENLLSYIKEPNDNVSEYTLGRNARVNLLNMLATLEVDVHRNFPDVAHESSQTTAEEESEETEESETLSYSDAEINGRIMNLASRLYQDMEVISRSFNKTENNSNSTTGYLEKLNSAKYRMGSLIVMHENFFNEEMGLEDVSEDGRVRLYEEMIDIHSIGYWLVHSNYKINESNVKFNAFPNVSTAVPILPKLNETSKASLNATARFGPFVDRFFDGEDGISEFLQEVSDKVANETKEFQKEIQIFIDENRNRIVTHTTGENVTFDVSDKNNSKAKTSFDSLTELDLQMQKEVEDALNETGRTPKLSQMSILLEEFQSWIPRAFASNCLANFTDELCEVLQQAVRSNLKHLNNTIADIIQALPPPHSSNSTSENETRIIFKASARFFDGEHANFSRMHDEAMEEIESMHVAHEFDVHPQRVFDEMENPMKNDSRIFRQLAESYQGRNNSNDSFYQRGSHESRSTNISLEKVQLGRPIKVAPFVDDEKQARQSNNSNNTTLIDMRNEHQRPDKLLDLDENVTISTVKLTTLQTITSTRAPSTLPVTVATTAGTRTEQTVPVAYKETTPVHNFTVPSTNYSLNYSTSTVSQTVNYTTVPTYAVTNPTYAATNPTSKPYPTYTSGNGHHYDFIPIFGSNQKLNFEDYIQDKFVKEPDFYGKPGFLPEPPNRYAPKSAWIPRDGDRPRFPFQKTPRYRKPEDAEWWTYPETSNYHYPSASQNFPLNFDGSFSLDNLLGNLPMSPAHLSHEIMCFGAKDCAKDLNEVCIRTSHESYCDCPLDTIRNQITKVCESLRHYGYLSRHKRSATHDEISKMPTCSSDFCFNRGQCKISPENDTICICDNWYNGINCQQDVMIVMISVMVGASLIVLTISFLGIFFCGRNPLVEGWIPLHY